METTPDIVMVGLSGRRGAGKDTAADGIEKHYSENYHVYRFSFASPLKTFLCMLSPTLKSLVGDDTTMRLEKTKALHLPPLSPIDSGGTRPSFPTEIVFSE
jgi:hypothetical protein